MNTPKIIWRYHYLQACRKIDINEKIDITPDKFNRWQIRGNIIVRTKAIPEYKWVGRYIEIPFAVIQQKGCAGSYVPSTVDNFCCSLTSIYDANLGYGTTNYFGNTPNAVMIQVQKEFEKLYTIFHNIIVPKEK